MTLDILRPELPRRVYSILGASLVDIFELDCCWSVAYDLNAFATVIDLVKESVGSRLESMERRMKVGKIVVFVL